MRAKKIIAQRSINESDVIIATKRRRKSRASLPLSKVLLFMVFTIVLAAGYTFLQKVVDTLNSFL